MIEFRNYSFRYEEAEGFTLKNIDFSVADGEVILLTGRSGCGKTTLIRSLNGLIPHFYPGEMQGDLLLDGMSVLEMKPADLAGRIGTVFQDPRSQFFMTDTTRELAFGCENMGFEREETISRVEKAAKELKLENYLNRSIFALSSGEKQQIAIGSVYALEPKVYIFDEPSANLDYDATKRLAQIIRKLKKEGCTILIAEHRFYYLRDLIDRVFWIQNGEIKREYSREEFCDLDRETRISNGMRTPFPENDIEMNEDNYQIGENILEIKGLHFAYSGGPNVLKDVSFSARTGDIVGILGTNGAGKTTLLSVMTGILKENSGEIAYNGQRLRRKDRRKISYLVMQDADYQLFSSSVEEELSLGIDAECSEKVTQTLQELDLESYRKRHPMSLSGGQKQRVTIGAAMIKERAVVCFDEPTSGLDYDSMIRVSRRIKELAAKGIIVFVVSHDFEFIARTCTKVIQLEKNRTSEGTLTSEMLQRLAKKYFYDPTGTTTSQSKVVERRRKGMFDKIFEYAGPYKKGIYQATAILLLSVLMGVLPFVFAYQVIMPLISGQTLDTSYVFLRILGVLVCLLAQAWLYGLGLCISHKTAYNTLLRLRTALQKRFENLPLGVIEEKGTGTIKKLFVDDVDSLELLLAHSLPEGIANLMVPVAVYIAMFCVDWKLAFLSLASIPLSFVAMMVMYSVGMKQMGAYYQSGQIMNNTIIEYINGMEVIKVFNKVGQSYERFRNDVSNYRDYTLNWYKACWPWMAIYNALLPCTIILTLPLGAFFVLKGYSALADLILILCLSLSIGIPLLKALGFLPTMPQLNYKITALEQVLSEQPLQQTREAFHGQGHSVCFDNVTFGYSKTISAPGGQSVVTVKNVIHGVSFTAESGQKTALVGESGSGKSTLAKLLVHYYDVQDGSILVGGQKLTDMSLAALNEQISYVAQDQYLFNTSILENIRAGRLNATDEEVLDAARKAQCIEFIEKLPEGIHSVAGDSGKMLSGGQRQRISLARAILKNAPIVVLDEATAFADPENEDKMEAAIAELVKDKTLIVIAHKLTSIKDADKIIVMDQGNLVGCAKHEELLTYCKTYQKLWNAHQSSAQWNIRTVKEGK